MAAFGQAELRGPAAAFGQAGPQGSAEPEPHCRQRVAGCEKPAARDGAGPAAEVRVDVVEAHEVREAHATSLVVLDVDSALTAPFSRSTATSCFGILLALGLGAALLTEIVLVVQDFSRRERYYEQEKCAENVAAITTWGEWLAGEAYALGVSMFLESQLGLAARPFLLASPLSAQTQSYKMKNMQVLRGGTSSHMTPSIIWHPTVLDEDREEYEQFMSAALGYPVNITVFDYVASQGYDIRNKAPAPKAPTYHPASFGWSVLDDAVSNVIENGVVKNKVAGVGALSSLAKNGEEKLFAELTVLRKRITHTAHEENKAVADDLFFVEIPFCGLGTCADGELVGFFSFWLAADYWSELFPDNVEVRIGTTGDLVKTPDKNRGGGGDSNKVHAREPFLDLDIKCYYVAQARLEYYRRPMFALTVCVAAAVAAIVALLVQDHRLRRRATETRLKEQNERLCAERHEAERVHAAKLSERSEANERMERYVNHEIKNRLVVLSQLCSEEAQLELVDEMAETLNEKMVLVRLSSACYTARLDETMDLDSLIDKRLQRHSGANCAFVRTPTTGPAAATTSALRLDTLLVKIVVDNILSNAFKYGSTTHPPSLTMHVEPDGSAHVRVVIELTNWAGPEHAALLTMGEAELNRVAGAEGERAHTSTANSISSGDGFPMAVVAARALGGTLKLKLSKAGVVAHLALSKVALDVIGAQRSSSASSAAAPVGEARPVDPSRLSMALVDDSPLQRKIFQRYIGKIAPHGPPVVVAGDTRESIDDFARVVCDADVDVVFADQHFAPVHHTKAGTDIVREIRARDAAAGRPPRLVFISSGNDSREDAAAYVQAGADGSLSKISLPQLKLILEKHATTAHPRFEGRVAVLASEAL
ncbi:hypothetical protein M885DRAFT_515164, partial [Pelagophyceae sp. CCMP2097]